MNKKLFLTMLLSLSSVGFAQSYYDKLSLGLGVGYQQKPYIGDNSDWVPVPHLEYQSGPFFIKGLKLGVNVMEFSQTKVDLHLNYQALNFKPGDSHWPYSGLDKRKSTIQLGAGINHQFDNNVFISGDIQGDILGRSKDVVANANIGYVYRVNDHFTLVPRAGLTWDDKKHNRYYYGVSAEESARTGIHQYRPGSSVTPHIGIGMAVKATDRFHVFGGMEFQFLPGDVKDSPMTKRSTLSSFALGLNYNF
ncbi:MipA/OmpV family protein [Ignatzschineria larvae DSM 13226]|uniref:MipA/OmpV family protein n=1 Tax=Ignatzschineria larvae DSM 13226 TaxID=1111732 RepID=A0ABZ3C333_9GAMM|nr:MipA/OmpV family protein [Ignatzschineria larvae]